MEPKTTIDNLLKYTSGDDYKKVIEELAKILSVEQNPLMIMNAMININNKKLKEILEISTIQEIIPKIIAKEQLADFIKNMSKKGKAISLKEIRKKIMDTNEDFVKNINTEIKNIDNLATFLEEIHNKDSLKEATTKLEGDNEELKKYIQTTQKGILNFLSRLLIKPDQYSTKYMNKIIDVWDKNFSQNFNSIIKKISELIKESKDARAFSVKLSSLLQKEEGLIIHPEDKEVQEEKLKNRLDLFENLRTNASEEQKKRNKTIN